MVSLFPIIGIVVDGLMIGFIANNYMKTRFRPGVILLIQYIAFFMIHLLWIPISQLGEDQYELAKDIMIGVIFVVLSFPSLTIGFFESTRNKPINLLMLLFNIYYVFLLGYGFSIEWIFKFQRIWLYQISGAVLILFIIPFAGVVIYVFVRLIFLILNIPRKASLNMQWGFGKRSKTLVLIWTGGLLFRYLSILLISTQGVSEFSFLMLLMSVFTIALVFLYDPSSFFLSDAQIQEFLIFNAQTGIKLFSMGSSKDDLKASGLLGASILEREISGASSLPHTLVFIDRIILIEYQQLEGIHLAAAMIVDKNNPVFLPSLKFCFHQFIKTYRKKLKNWQADQSIFNDFNAIAIKIFSYAYPLESRKKSKADLT